MKHIFFIYLSFTYFSFKLHKSNCIMILFEIIVDMCQCFYRFVYSFQIMAEIQRKKNHIEFSCSIFMSFSISDVNLVKHYFSLFGFVWYKSTFDVPGRMSVRPAVCPSVWLSMEILWWNFNVDKNILTKIVWKQKNLLDISCIIFFIPFSMICEFSFVFDIEGKNK